ncbi:molybdate transporter 1 isoform X2 [Momordica charantia]|uniref:Molybdate transporter 1 isoform X2 n=1 Tax=Momordica charantia TaxID=3673 RepID=A0A6J1BQ32_MOMCH|nr:molybdate transporter 1 isoform X2 [Momordica charantia]
MASQNRPSPTLETIENQPQPGIPGRIVEKLKANLVFRSKWGEINGAMGDLGTYIPIVLALTLSKDLNLGTTLIFTGIYNVVTGLIYGVPMPVQPMKSIVAAALADADFGVAEIMAAGILTGGILFVLGATGLMRLVYRWIPLPVVRGIQLAQGLSFALTAVKYVRYDQNMAKSKSLGGREWLGLDGLVLAIVCACFVIVVNGAGEEEQHLQEPTNVENGRAKESGKEKARKIITSLPSAFIIFLLGLVFLFIRSPKVVKYVTFGPSPMSIVKITSSQWKKGFIKGTIPQLPLSILNSIIAVCNLSLDLFPGKIFSVTSLSITVGLMNLVGCWFGAVPTCHGAGGLAGQYKFGGRSGGCVVLLGTAKLLLGLVLGSSIAKVLNEFPVGILGVLLLFAGVELAMAARDMNSKEQAFVMLICAGVSLVGSSAALGFLCAMVVHVLLWLRKLGRQQHQLP